MSLVTLIKPRLSCRSVVCATSLFIAILTAAPASAQLAATDAGRYDNTGFHDTEFNGYMTGVFDDTFVFRSFFAFDASLIPTDANLANAQLALFNPSGGFGSDLGSETIEIRGLNLSSVSVDSLLDGSAGLDGYDALGSGTLFGSAELSASDAGVWVRIALNQAFVDFVQANGSGTIVLGASLSSLSAADAGFNEFVFAGTDGSPAPRLEFTPVPEPSTYALGAMLLVAGAVVLRRRRALSVASAAA